MDPRICSEYQRLRGKGWRAADAMRAARVNVAFDEAEEEGLVRFRVEPECEPYDSSYVDTWEESPARAQRIKRELDDRIERDGHWYIAADVLCCAEHDHWSRVDGVGGFIGEDFIDSGYDVDVREAALHAVCERLQKADGIKPYFTVLIPFSEHPTEWHPTDPDFAPLSRGVFSTKQEAHDWAAAHLDGQPYGIKRIEPFASLSVRVH
jgi:hypothetical protein